MDLMATMRKLALWIRLRISPCRPRPTASGLIIAKVRSRAKIDFLQKLNAGETPAVRYFKAAAAVDPKSAGVSTQRIPAAAMAAYLSLAVPCPPLMMAPA